MKAPFSFSQSSIASWCLSNQPVVPEITGTLFLMQLEILSNAEVGMLKSIATSAK